MAKKPPPLLYQNFTVAGSTHFPIDMLRTERCWPASELDALAIVDTFSPENIGTERTVNLSRIVASMRHTDLVDSRWESFGWRVTGSSTERKP